MDAHADTITLTVDKFEQRYLNRPYELIEGSPVKVSPSAYKHGDIANLLGYYLRHHVMTHKTGGSVVGAETGFRLSETTMRAPDAAYIGPEKRKLIVNPLRFLPFAPDLAVEIIAPGERRGTIAKKLALYQAASVPLVWLIYLTKPRAVVYAHNQPPVTIPLTGTLTGGDVLPGFQIAVLALFSPIE